MCLGDLVEDEYTSPDAILTRIVLRETLTTIFSVLKPRERDILLKRLGLAASRSTQEARSKEYGVTRRRIAQIEAEAVRKMERKLRQMAL
jgi:RNA polymerase primary sigma factor